jgi:AcrR family transcriptional regulator
MRVLDVCHRLMTPLELKGRGQAATGIPDVRQHRAPSVRQSVGQAQRLRILSALAELVSEHGRESVTVSGIVGHARVSRQAFYLLFQSREDCFEAALAEAVALGVERAAPAYRSQPSWLDGIRAGLLALLELFDEQPELANLCVLQVMAAPRAALARRSELLGDLAAVVDEGRGEAHPGQALTALTAEGVIGGVLAIIQERLLQRQPQPLAELLNPLMAMIVLPYMGSAASAREAERAPGRRVFALASRKSAPKPLDGLNIRLTYRTMRVMTVIAAQPGLSNLDVSRRAGITDQGQISKLLARLASCGLLENTGTGQPRGGPNAWRLTPRGRQVEWTFGREAAATEPWWLGSR